MSLDERISNYKNRLKRASTKSYIKVIPPEEATNPILKRMYKRVGASRGSIANVHQSQSLNPEAMKAHLDLYMSTVYKEDTTLSRKERELIATAVSFFNGCEYCIVHHYEALLSHWEDAPEIWEILVKRKELLSEREQVLVEYAELLTISPHKMGIHIVDRLRKHGLEDVDVLDITLIISYFNFVNRLVMGTGVPLESKEERSYKF